MKTIKYQQKRLELTLNNGFKVAKGYTFAEIQNAERIANERQQKNVKKTASVKVATPHKLDNVIRKHIGAQMYECDLLHGKNETSKAKFFARKK